MDESFAVRVGEFEGPMELLLELVEEQKLPINQVALATVADSFLEYLKQLPKSLSANGQAEMNVLGNFVVFTGALFGVFAVATSYITFGLYLKDMLVYDLSINKILALLFIISAPIALVFLHSDSFIVVLGFIGAIFGGLESIFLIYTYKKAKQKGDRTPEYAYNIPAPLLNILIAVFIFGIFYTLFFDGKI